MQKTQPDFFIRANWPAPKGIIAGTTTRRGGYSQAPYDSLNLGLHVGDDPSVVLQNRAELENRLCLPNPPYWLDQVHGTNVVLAKNIAEQAPQADASYTTEPNTICAILTADCLPVLFCSKQGDVIGAAHAGWKGLQAGVLEAVVKAMNCPLQKLMAWLGPAIGPSAYEVGPEVYQAFVKDDPKAAQAFSKGREDRYYANLYELAKQRLQALGLNAIYTENYCTFSDQERFFSYRREGKTGRMASLIFRAHS